MVGTVISHAEDLSYLLFSSWGVTLRSGSLHLKGRAKGETLKKGRKKTTQASKLCVRSRNPPFMQLISYSAANMMLQASGRRSLEHLYLLCLLDLQLQTKKIQHTKLTNQLVVCQKLRWKTKRRSKREQTQTVEGLPKHFTSSYF